MNIVKVRELSLVLFFCGFVNLVICIDILLLTSFSNFVWIVFFSWFCYFFGSTITVLALKDELIKEKSN